MASSVKYGCLYIAGRRHVYRLELDDDGATTRWPLKEKLHSLSSTPDDSNVVVTHRAVNKLIEYTTHGDHVREISLKGDIVKPQHAVQLTTGDEFVVSQGDWSDPQHSAASSSSVPTDASEYLSAVHEFFIWKYDGLFCQSCEVTSSFYSAFKAVSCQCYYYVCTH